LMVLVIGSRASAAAFRRTLRSPAVPVGPVGYPPDSERVPKFDRASGSEIGRAQGEAGGEDVPASSPADDVGAMPTWAPKFARSRAGSPTRATRHKAIFSPATPPYPKGGA